MAAAAKPKSSAEIDGTAWWQALKSSNSFVPDPLDRVRPHPTPRVLQPQHNCASDPKPQLRFFRGQPHTAAALRVQGGNGGLPVPPHHFVLGDASPFVFELGHHADWSRIVWCAHFGDDTVNFTGTGQGGAIAAVFDIALTMAATSFFQQAPEAEGGKPDAYCVTVSLPACRRRSSLGGVLTPTPPLCCRRA